MNLRTFIERAEKCAGSQKKLGEQIGQSPSALRSAKAGLIGLPNYACIMIADMIGEDRITVIAASELATEKKENRKKIWQAIISHVSVLTFCALITPFALSFHKDLTLLPSSCNLGTFLPHYCQPGSWSAAKTNRYTPPHTVALQQAIIINALAVNTRG